VVADPWAAWRALNGWPGSIGQTGAALHRGTGAAPAFAPGDIAERFNQAARAFLGAAGTGSAGGPAAPNGDAARLFGDAVRDVFSTLQPLHFNGLAGNTQDGLAAAPDVGAFGPTREHQLRWQRLTETWRQLDEAQRRLQRLWLDALRDAGSAFSAGLARTAAAAGTPATGVDPAEIRRLYDRWIDCAEDAYSRVAHGAAFCDALADAVNAGARWRRELKALVEESAKLLDLPTRSEVNSLQQRLRAVEADLREARQRPGAAAPAKQRPRRPGET